jgi:hypothetical protein
MNLIHHPFKTRIDILIIGCLDVIFNELPAKLTIFKGRTPEQEGPFQPQIPECYRIPPVELYSFYFRRLVHCLYRKLYFNGNMSSIEDKMLGMKKVGLDRKDGKS